MQMRVSLGIWLPLVGALLGCGASDAPLARPNIFLFTVESLRPDHIGLYTGQRDTTPNLDAFARESMVYEDAHSVTSWTLASHASIFTGLYPTAHGTTGARSKLPDEAHTLADLLAARGYQTAGVASGPYLARGHNLNQGFAFYDDSAATIGTQGGAHDDITNPLLEKIINRFLTSYRDAQQPLFLFAYFWDPHYDYIPPAPYDTMFLADGAERINVRDYESSSSVTKALTPGELAYVLSQYDGEIRYTDMYLGRLFEALKQADLWEDSVVIVTSDHGEEFFDHGEKGHKRSLYAESVHVPLLIKYPRSARIGRDARLVSLVDLFPTILELSGADSPAAHQGRSLLEAEPDPERPIFFELLSTFYHRATDGRYSREDEAWMAVRRGEHKLIVVPSQERAELYRVSRDPTEQNDIALGEPERVAELSHVLDLWKRDAKQLANTGASTEANLDPEQLERLRALGYLDRPQSAPAEPARSE
jgi:arylsulfatase A-like enzyme